MNFTKKMLILAATLACLLSLSAPAYASDGSSLWSDIKDKGSELMGAIKEEAPGALASAKEKGGELLDQAKGGLDAIADAAGGATYTEQQNSFFGWFGQMTGTGSNATDAPEAQDGSGAKDSSIDPVYGKSGTDARTSNETETPGITTGDLEALQQQDIYYYNPDYTSDQTETAPATEAPTSIVDNSQTYNDNRVYNYYGDQQQEEAPQGNLPSGVVATTTTTYTKQILPGLELETDRDGRLTDDSMSFLVFIGLFSTLIAAILFVFLYRLFLGDLLWRCGQFLKKGKDK